MSKVIKVKSWQDLKNLPTKGICEIEYKNGDIAEFDVLGLTKPVIDELTAYYDNQKPMKPTRMMKPKGSEKPITVEVTEGSEYDTYKAENDRLDSRRMGALAVSFLPEELRPDITITQAGDVKKDKFALLEAQATELLNYIVAGNFIKIISAGYGASGFDVDSNSKVESAKNS